MGLIVALFVAGIMILIAYSTLNGPRYRVEVCMVYDGRSACRTVRGKSEESALRSAITNACADIASGVTDTMRCEQSTPQSQKWLQRPAQ